MAFHHAGHQEPALCVDDVRRALGRDLVAAAGHGFDPVGLHQNFAGVGLVAKSVPDHRVLDQRCRHDKILPE